MSEELSKEEKLGQLNKILHSRTMQGSNYLKSFLQFVVLRALDVDGVQLKEYTIATEVFGRDTSFDPRYDSVVRTHAGRLRNKLHEYYESEGANDQILIALPKGQYVPTFSPATDQNNTNGAPQTDAVGAGGLVPATGSATTRPASAVQEPAGVSPPTPVHLWKLLCGALALACLLLVWALYHTRQEARLRENAFVEQSRKAHALRTAALPWQPFLHSPQSILIAYSNSLFEPHPTDRGWMKHATPAETWDRDRGKALSPNLIDMFSDVGEVAGGHALGAFFEKVGHPSRIKRSLLLTWDEIKTENLVVLGSPAQNHFLRDLPQEQHFVFRLFPNEKGGMTFAVVNLQPRTGEQPAYYAEGNGPSLLTMKEDYAVISMLKGLGDSNKLMILAGLSTLGTQAAAEYVTRPEYLKDLITRLDTIPGTGSPTLPEHYQVLIKVKINGGVPVQMSYVTHHVID